jgi:hypothetical protein
MAEDGRSRDLFGVGSVRVPCKVLRQELGFSKVRVFGQISSQQLRPTQIFVQIFLLKIGFLPNTQTVPVLSLENPESPQTLPKHQFKDRVLPDIKAGPYDRPSGRNPPNESLLGASTERWGIPTLGCSKNG